MGEFGGLGRGWVGRDVQLGLVSLMGKGWGGSGAGRGCLCVAARQREPGRGV